MKKITVFLIVLSMLIPCGTFAAGESASFSPSYISLYVGEACGVSVTTDAQNLVWRINGSDAIELFGDYYKSKTVYALKAGQSVIWVSDEEGNDLANVVVNVSEKPELQTTEASFSRGEAVEADKNVFGEHLLTYTTYSDPYKLVEENIAFGSARVAFKPDDTVTDYTEFAKTYLTPVMRNNMTVVVILSRIVTDDVSALMEQVKAICTVLGDYQDAIYIEYGNETMTQISDTFTIDDYITKCKSLYQLIKEYGSEEGIDIYTGIPFAEMTVKGSSWVEVMSADQTYYDAVVPHLYTYISTYDGYTQNVKMQRLFSSNENMYKSVEYAKKSFQEKDIWITEYGCLDAAMLGGATSAEKARMQSQKTLGVALSNIDMAMKFLADPSVKFANYHFPNDYQCFGIVQGTDKLPNFYAFKGLSDVLSESTYVAKLIPSDVPEFSFVGYNTTGKTTVSSLSGYSFSNSEGLKYVIFINRAENPCSVSFSGNKLKPVWKYSSDYVLGENYLRVTGSYTDMPSYVPEPQTITDASASETVTLDGYSMTVCAVTEEALESLTVSCELDGKAGVPTQVQAVLKLSDIAVLTSENVTVTANGEKVPVTLTGSGSQYVAEFDKEPNTEYVIYVGKKAAVTFTTAHNTELASISANTPAGEGRTAEFGKDLSEITLKINFISTYGLPSYKYIWLSDDGAFVSKLGVTNANDAIRIEIYRYENGTPYGPGILLDGVTFTDTVYVTYKDGTIYPFAVSTDGTVKCGTVEHCIKDTDGWQICDELKPYANEIIDKITFGSIELPERIKNISDDVEEIVLCGLCTDICVISNAMILKAAFPEIKIAVDAKCCAGVTQESHNTALSAMKSVQIDVI